MSGSDIGFSLKDVHCPAGLKTGERVLEALLNYLDQEGEKSPGSKLQKFERYVYRNPVILLVSVVEHGDSGPTFRVKSRDISRSGIGFLHGVPVHVGSSCSVMLVAARQMGMRINGNVVRCRLVRGKIYDVGVKFDNLIDLAEFIQSGLIQSVDAES